jgi:hypothetical protein
MVLRFVVDVHTTCFGLHGHLQVCKIFYFLVLKESASLLFFFAAVSCLQILSPKFCILFNNVLHVQPMSVEIYKNALCRISDLTVIPTKDGSITAKTKSETTHTR